MTIFTAFCILSSGKQALFGKEANRMPNETNRWELARIQETILQVAEAITAALEIDTEIVDSSLRIIGGTGRYRYKIGHFEENGDTSSGLIYAKLLRLGADYVCRDAQNDREYRATEGELAEICCPIRLDGQVIGLIGLVAFEEGQRKKIVQKTDTYLVFLNRMAELIASKLAMTCSRDVLKDKLDAILLPSAGGSTFDDIVGVSHKINLVKKRGMQVAESDSTILITGESGCGKELLARAIHSRSNRKNGPFIALNCASIPEMLLESELFGYEKGAFTGAAQSGKIGRFELADGGTLFLDEIGDMPLHLQVKLLDAIQNRTLNRVGGLEPVPIDIRIIAATNQDLEEMMENRLFREDLYFRLNVIPLEIPPLRERREDIPPLLEKILENFIVLMGKKIEGFSPEAMQRLLEYSWPGNVRELENVVEYAVNMETEAWISPSNLPRRVLRNDTAGFGGGCRDASLKERTDLFQKAEIAECLRTLGETAKLREGKRRAAEKLGISESSLYRRMRELGIPLN